MDHDKQRQEAVARAILLALHGPDAHWMPIERGMKLAQAALSVIVPNEWQTIETAPKDGTRMDVWVVHMNGSAEREVDVWWDAEKAYRVDRDRSRPLRIGNFVLWDQREGCDYALEVDGTKITHWMPSPKPPG